MTKFLPCSIVVTYDENRQQLILQCVMPERLSSALKGASEIPVLLDEFNFKIDDEFVRRFGGGIVKILSMGQPDLKQYMTFTESPLDKLSEG
ncbi:hypothetical protein [Paraburkholderia xenovorans]